MALRSGLGERGDDGEDGPEPGATHAIYAALFRDDHVIDVHVGGELPAVGKQIVDHAGLVGDVQAALLDRDFELVRA